MLQWMGGSRRKVTTSRKSTHKRQKQYFEQRKRQQQQHTVGLDSCTDGRRLCIENNRSLDVLSLVNVSTAALERKTICVSGNKSEDYDFTLNHQYALPYQANLDDEAFPVDQAEINEERTPSSYGTEAEYSEKVSIHLPDHIEDLAGNGNKLDPFKLSATLSEISVIDLLSDSGTNINAEENSVHAQEAHVAFSIEGLGKVEAETPLRSPKISGRSFPSGFSPQKIARRQPITSRHPDYGFHDLGARVDVVMQDVDVSTYYSSIEQTLGSKDIMNITGDPNLMFSNFSCSSPLNWDGSKSEEAFDNDELIYNIRDCDRNIWGGPSLLDHSSDDLGEHETFCKNWVDQRNVPYDDYFYYNDLWKQDLNFDDWNLQKKRFHTERTVNLDIRESPVPCSKHQTTEDLPDKISNTRYSAIRIDNDVKDDVNCFVGEDNRESLSLLSEESCSSTAVRVMQPGNHEK